MLDNYVSLQNSNAGTETLLKSVFCCCDCKPHGGSFIKKKKKRSYFICGFGSLRVWQYPLGTQWESSCRVMVWSGGIIWPEQASQPEAAQSCKTAIPMIIHSFPQPINLLTDLSISEGACRAQLSLQGPTCFYLFRADNWD